MDIYNPNYHGPAGRTHVADMLVYNRNPTDATDDPWILRMLDYLKHKDDPAAELDPIIDQAPQVRYTPTGWAIEAYLITELSHGEIGSRVRLSEDVITAYEALFFDVQEMLDRPAVMYCQVVPNIAVHTLAPQNVDRIWRHYAWEGGHRVLDGVIEAFNIRGESDYSFLLGEEYEPHNSDMYARIERNIQWLIMPLSERAKLAELQAQMDEIERLRAGIEKQKMPIKPMIDWKKIKTNQ